MEGPSSGFKKKIYIDLDIFPSRKYIGTLKQNNTNSLEFVIKLKDGTKPFDISVASHGTITIKRPNGSLSNSNVTIIENEITYTLEPNAVNLPGAYEVEVQLFAGESVLVSSSFYYSITTALFNDEGITAQENYPILVTLISEVEAVLDLAGPASENEPERIAAETIRVSNESARVTSESSRVSNESTRVTNEQARVTNELSRLNEEQTRSQNEQARTQDEQARATAEATRISNESTRQTFFNDYGAVITKSSSFSIRSTEVNKVILASALQTITIDTTSNTQVPVNSQINIIRTGTGEVTITNNAGSIVSKDSMRRIANQYDVVTLIKTSASAWLLIGSLKG